MNKRTEKPVDSCEEHQEIELKRKTKMLEVKSNESSKHLNKDDTKRKSEHCNQEMIMLGTCPSSNQETKELKLIQRQVWHSKDIFSFKSKRGLSSNDKITTQEDDLLHIRKFDRLRQAYVETLRLPRTRTTSDPGNTTLSTHRQPNPEYIQGINAGAAFDLETRKDASRAEMSQGADQISSADDNHLYDDIFSALNDMDSFLKEIKLAPLSEHHAKERSRVENVVHSLQLKVAEHVHEIQRVNGVKSPRPTRKNSPLQDDRSHFFLQELSAERSDLMQARMTQRISYSPEAKRRLEAAKIRPRSISCPEIRYTPPHGWKTSLPKVPENEEFKEDDEKENKIRK